MEEARGLYRREATMIVLKLISGVTDHLRLRQGEWLGLWPLTWWYFALIHDDGRFESAKTFAPLTDLMSARAWSWVLLLALTARLTALIVNGTFRERFIYSPHLRAWASFIACGFWFLVAYGSARSAVEFGGQYTAWAMYSWAVIAEAANFVIAQNDRGKAQLEFRGGRGGFF